MNKTCFSLFLAFIMLLTTIPFTAAADNTSDYDEIIDLACQIYPEHADKIRYQTITSADNTRSSDPILIYSDSRKISENETLLYSEYSNGIILLTDYDFYEVVTPVDSATGAGATAYTCNVRAACTNIAGYFQINNFKYTLVSSTYDRIDSLGTYYAYEESNNGIENDCYFSASSKNPRTQMTETASSDAYANFSLQFRFSARQNDFFTSLLKISVGNNSMAVEHNQP